MVGMNIEIQTMVSEIKCYSKLDLVLITATSFQGNTTTGDGWTEDLLPKYYITSNQLCGYRFAGPGVLNSTNCALYFHRGFTYILENSKDGCMIPFVINSHQWWFKLCSWGKFPTGSQNGTQILTVPFDGPSSIVYQCTLHGGMLGTINVT